jgi:magnesium chelatase family protein
LLNFGELFINEEIILKYRMKQYGTCRTVTLNSLTAEQVTVEASLASGLPHFAIVGLANKSIQEAKERIKTAFLNSGFAWPRGRIIVNLQPASSYKDGTHFDLPIAVAILRAQSVIDQDFQAIFFGELSLSGNILVPRGIIQAGNFCLENKATIYCAPRDVLSFFTLDKRLFNRLDQLVLFLQGKTPYVSPEQSINAEIPEDKDNLPDEYIELFGQEKALRALIIACVGSHHLALIGAPGIGKSFLASRAYKLLPKLSKEEAMQLAAIFDMFGESRGISYDPPYRYPHSSSSMAAIIGGGSPLRPGELSLAHLGILHLDELSEFAPKVVESLRSPLDTGCVALARARHREIYPCKTQLIITANPCRCGFALERRCGCRKKFAILSGPIADRIHIKVYMKSEPLSLNGKKIKLPPLRRKITLARQRAALRKKQMIKNNQKFKDLIKAQPRDLQKYTIELVNHFGLSPRVYNKIWELAFTIGDYEEKSIDRPIIIEALSYVHPESEK